MDRPGLRAIVSWSWYRAVLEVCMLQLHPWKCIRNKKRFQMKKVYPVISEISDVLPLTSVGVCKLMAFDEGVVTRAFKVLKETKNIRKPWSLLMKMAMQYSQEQGIQLDWTTTGALCKLLNIDGTGPEVEFEGFRKGVSFAFPSNGKVERPAQYYTSLLSRDLGNEDPYASACEFYDNLLVDTVHEKSGFVITPLAKQRVTGGVNPHWKNLSKEQQQQLKDVYPQFALVEQGGNFLQALTQG